MFRTERCRNFYLISRRLRASVDRVPRIRNKYERVTRAIPPRDPEDRYFLSVMIDPARTRPGVRVTRVTRVSTCHGLRYSHLLSASNKLSFSRVVGGAVGELDLALDSGPDVSCPRPLKQMPARGKQFGYVEEIVNGRG